MRAVGGDQVVGADGLLGAAVPGAEDRRDPVVVLLEGDQLGGVGVLGAALLGRPAACRSPASTLRSQKAVDRIMCRSIGGSRLATIER